MKRITQLPACEKHKRANHLLAPHVEARKEEVHELKRSFNVLHCSTFKVFTIRGLIKDIFFVRVLCVYDLRIRTQIRNQTDGILVILRKLFSGSSYFLLEKWSGVMSCIFRLPFVLYFVYGIVYRTQKSEIIRLYSVSSWQMAGTCHEKKPHWVLFHSNFAQLCTMSSLWPRENSYHRYAASVVSRSALEALKGFENV